MKLVIEVDETRLQERINEQIREVLIGEILRVHNSDMRKLITEAARSQVAEKIVAAIMPTREDLKQLVDQEVKRHARKLIGKMMGEP